MKLAKRATAKELEKLGEELKRVYPPLSAIRITMAWKSYTPSKPIEYGLYAPGIAQFDWKYFDTWEELIQFCEQLIVEKEVGKQ
jgi:hypothetical protein